MPDTIPSWLATAESLVGNITDGPPILPLAKKIGEVYPEMAAYCRMVGPATAWCGLFDAYCLTLAGVRPPYTPGSDIGSFLWVDSWADTGWGTPVQPGNEQPGDVLIFRSPHHVTFYVGDDGNRYRCCG